MSLDIKYRPRKYADVLGQDATIKILKQFVASGRGFQQSYLFCGAHGSGKTTLGRILARALLCENPKNGEPCDECVSCKSLLKDGSSVDFTEVDAATNSGKAEITKIKELLQYSSFSGRHRLYLFDEAHQLTAGALDGLLKPMEDKVAGSDDKQLVCIFCTTEPEKMRATVLSRCAPAFVIEPQGVEEIAQRMAFICDQEGIAYELEALQIVADITECHIRDALKAVEGVSMLGKVTKETVAEYLHLDLNTAYLDILLNLGNDLSHATELAREAMTRASPAIVYEKLADAAMSAFQLRLGLKGATHWERSRLEQLSERGDVLLGYTDRFAARPKRATPAMLLCDLALLHYGGGAVGVGVRLVVPEKQPSLATATLIPSSLKTSTPATPPSTETVPLVSAQSASSGRMRNALTDDPLSPMFVDPRAVVRRDTEVTTAPGFVLEPDAFCDLLTKAMLEMRSARAGRSAR